MTPKRADESAEEMPPRELTPGTSAFDRRCYALFHEWANGCADFEPIDQDHAGALIGALIGGIRNLLMREIRKTSESLLHAAKEQAKRDVAEAMGKLEEIRSALTALSEANIIDWQTPEKDYGKVRHTRNVLEAKGKEALTQLDAAIALLREGK